MLQKNVVKTITKEQKVNEKSSFESRSRNTIKPKSIASDVPLTRLTKRLFNNKNKPKLPHFIKQKRERSRTTKVRII